ncbi:Ivy family c-type lysozyme inhibitor [Pseudomonas sp. NPDC007930]|uniref:inhibitor of vertebrate lysozyme family protein n=1 Tax=Pseudomonas sp. NPDC007930 TaxID=3364417 RepID=UPI0036EFEFFE
MIGKAFKPLLAGLMLASSAVALAGNDGQDRASELVSTDKDYRSAWQHLVQQQERLPDWIINLSGYSPPLAATTEDGDKYLVGEVCEQEQQCRNNRVIVAFSWNKAHAYALWVQVPAGLPADKSPTQHADYRWLGDPDPGMQTLLMEQLKKDPNWY